MRRARRLYADREAVIDPSTSLGAGPSTSLGAGPSTSLGAGPSTSLGAGSDTRWTYAQFFDRCDRWSSALQALGVRKGDRVAYIAPNTHAQLTSFYAVPQIGAVLVPINYRLVADDFKYLIQHSGAKVVCVDRDYLDVVDALRPQLSNVQHFVALSSAPNGWLDYETLVRDAAPTVDRPGIDESDLLTINYTSGTTSRPKGVMITHRNAWMNAVGTLVHVPMTPADRYLWTLPMFHANGWTFTWIVTAAGGTHVCLRKVEPSAVFTLAKQERITMLCAAPTILIGLANAPDEMKAGVPRGVRVLTAGAPPAAITIQRLEEGLGWSVTHVYGLTETAPFITVCEPRPEHASLSAQERAVIKARQGVELITSGELRVVTDAGQEVPHDGETMGEIVARGNVVMAGYYNDPDATAKVIRNGWFHSGDAAVVHPDGYVEIRDRLKDVIISGGENISSVEVEAMLLRHPAVQEAAVVGLPDEKWGEAPHAWVVVKGGATLADGELRAFCRDNMAHFKVPHSFNLVTELPKTATGKIQKYVLRGGKPAIARQ
jgi:fatty-acyl-CoA synthase